MLLAPRTHSTAADLLRLLATWLAGSFAVAALLGTCVAAMVTLAQQAWLRIAVRVMGPWIAAAAPLVLALSFAAKRGA